MNFVPPPKPSKFVLSVKVTGPLRERVRAAAKAQKMTVSDYLWSVIETELDRPENEDEYRRGWRMGYKAGAEGVRQNVLTAVGSLRKPTDPDQEE